MTILSVRFRQGGRCHLYDAGEMEVQVGDEVVAVTEHGLQVGKVRSALKEVPEEDAPQDLKRVIRKANAEDLRRAEQNVEREKEALRKAAEKVVEHGLPMRLIKAEMTLDGNKTVIHFSAEGRVDFRTLVRDLARTLRCRVELHQVGVRDEAKLMGGLGACGRALCCASFLTDFEPVGIRMAKAQDLSLNPQKISGVCGRLMCCLGFEYGWYRAAKRGLPKLGTEVVTPQGTGRLSEVNVVTGQATVTLEEGTRVTVSLDDLAKQSRDRRRPGQQGREEAEKAEVENDA